MPSRKLCADSTTVVLVPSLHLISKATGSTDEVAHCTTIFFSSSLSCAALLMTGTLFHRAATVRLLAAEATPEAFTTGFPVSGLTSNRAGTTAYLCAPAFTPVSTTDGSVTISVSPSSSLTMAVPSLMYQPCVSGEPAFHFRLTTPSSSVSCLASVMVGARRHCVATVTAFAAERVPAS